MTLHEQNTVIRLNDAGGIHFLPISNGGTFVIDTSVIHQMDGGMFLLDSLRNAYNDGLREFSPWQSPFALGAGPTAFDLLHVFWPNGLVVELPYTEPIHPTAGQPAIQLRPEDGSRHRVHAHELGHALHFSQLSLDQRAKIEGHYIDYLLFGARSHSFSMRTTDMVAFLEAFGCFAEVYESTPTHRAESGPARHELFWERVDSLLANEDDHCGTGGIVPAVLGEDVEGAVFLTLYHEFARRPEVGLDFVVESVVECQALTLDGEDSYADCIRDTHGSGSAVYGALVASAARYGIGIPGYTGGVIGVAQSGDHFGATTATGDFNGDGRDDLVVGVPEEDIGGQEDAGAVHVLYGSHFGLLTAANQFWHSNKAGIPDPDPSGSLLGHSDVQGAAAPGERFGAALAVGDFDVDGFDDLAIGVPGQTVNGASEAGYVVVLYGSAIGLTTDGAETWHQDSIYVLDQAETGDHFGSALAAGDFDADGGDDLAIGSPDEDLGKANAIPDAGIVQIIRSSRFGLWSLGSRTFIQDSPGMPDHVEPYDRFGFSLAVGNFDGDEVTVDVNGERQLVSVEDLAIGTPYEGLVPVSGTSEVVAAGAVTVLYGEAGSGLTTARAALWHQDSPYVDGTVEAGDLFGYALAAGDFDYDRRDDLAIGVPGENVLGEPEAGAVHVLYGSIAGISFRRDQLWSQASASVGSSPRAGERFGSALAVGDFDGPDARNRRIDDLAIGVPFEDVGTQVGAGAVNILYGSEDVLSDDRSNAFSQNTGAVEDVSEAGDHFASSLAAGDFNGSGRDDLAIGVPDEGFSGLTQAGIVQVLQGYTGGVGPAGDVRWHQDR